MNLTGDISMKSVAAKEAKQSFGQLLDDAQRGPVTITRNGREIAVVLSKDEYARLEALEDAFWGRLAQKAEKEGYLGFEESEKLLKSYLNATD